MVAPRPGGRGRSARLAAPRGGALHRIDPGAAALNVAGRNLGDHGGRMPFPLRYGPSRAVAAGVYYPLARLRYLLERRGWNVGHVPPAASRWTSFYGMRTDAPDRFGTRLEKRFTAARIEDPMTAAAPEDVRFSQAVPCWCAAGARSSSPERPRVD